MKLVMTILIPILLVACFLIISRSNQPPPHREYLFVGYVISDGRQYSYGNIEYRGSKLPTYDSLRQFVYSKLSCQEVSIERLVITSIYRFQDSMEGQKFYGENHSAPIIPWQCDTFKIVKLYFSNDTLKTFQQ